jgi:hypothetical protein
MVGRRFNTMRVGDSRRWWVVDGGV